MIWCQTNTMSVVKKGRILFYNFIIYDNDCQFISQPFRENNVIFKSKKKLANAVTLYLAINEVLDNFIITNRHIMEHNFPVKDEILLKYVNKDDFYSEHLQTMISSIYCNGFDLKDFYNDKESTLFELDSKDTPLSSGESIKIYMKDIDTSFLIEKN